VKRVVVFGSGYVARPAVRTLLETGHAVRVATDQPAVAETMIDGHPHGEAVLANATDPASIRSMLEGADAAISLLPVSFHVRVARACLEAGVHFVTASYVSEEMRGLHEDACTRGLTFLNEVGADPGIDHMQAMRILDGIRESGGTPTGFYSVCGGLPAPEANDNPFGYKISWSTRGVALAGKRPVQFLRDGEIVVTKPFEIFQSPRRIHLEGLGDFEAYPNGDSVRFIEEYGLRDMQRMFRGSLRFTGWCETWAALAKLRLIDDRRAEGATYADAFRTAVAATPSQAPRDAAAALLGINDDHALLDRLEWLGLFEDAPITLENPTYLDLLVDRMDQRLRFAEGERDMLVLYHEVDYRDADGAQRQTRATMVEYGIPKGDSAMARTVGLPAAYAICRILDGSITRRGVCIPVDRESYEPILADLADAGIHEVVVES
jgi:saccharopine dehydrogenase-like NADP-dependent oxidoreductase